MAFVALIALSLAVTPLASAKSHSRFVSFGSKTAAAVRSDANLPRADVTLPISRAVPRSATRARLRHSLPQHAAARSRVTPLAGAFYDQDYIVNVTVGGTTFPMVLDTGSSDTWVIEKGFSCYNLTGSSEPPSQCAFGPARYDPKASKTYTPYPGRIFSIAYLSGQFLNGTVGFESISVGGVKVRKQEFGLVNEAGWPGDNVTGGVFGLGFPDITSVYTDRVSNTTQEPYNPFFFNAVKDKLVSNPYFSVALNRGSANDSPIYEPNLGYLSLGGIVSSVAIVAPSVTVPIQGTKLQNGSTDFSFYFVTVDSYTFPNSSKLVQSRRVVTIDTGSTVNLVPANIAAAYSAACEPPATFNKDFGFYATTCKAKVPPMVVTIGGEHFTIDGRDQLVPSGVNNADGDELCITGTQGGVEGEPDDIYILGDVFLRNVVLTANIASREVTLSQRKPY